MLPNGMINPHKAERLMSFARSTVGFPSAVENKFSGLISNASVIAFRVKPLGGFPASILWMVRKESPDFSANSD